MRIVILTQYFLPEIGAPQNRLFDLAKSIKNLGNEILVITAFPNYPVGKIFNGYRWILFKNEEIETIKILRTFIIAFPLRNLFIRLIGYFSFAFSSFIFGIFKIKSDDIVICESPPLFLGITLVLYKKIKRCKIVFNVSDLWPESAEKLGLIKNKFLLNITKSLANWIYKNSDLISGQTQGIVNAIMKLQPEKKVIWFPNGIDEKYLELPRNIDFRERFLLSNDKFIILYAGLMGYAQGLDIITNCAKRITNDKSVHFLLVGDGPEKESLIKTVTSEKLVNITVKESVTKSLMPSLINSCNALIVPLRKNDLFLGAIPSKIFEPLLLKKPVLLGVEGEAYDIFVKDGKCAIPFIPENVDSLVEAIYKLKNSKALVSTAVENGHSYVLNNFNKTKILNDYYNFIKS